MCEVTLITQTDKGNIAIFQSNSPQMPYSIFYRKDRSKLSEIHKIKAFRKGF